MSVTTGGRPAFSEPPPAATRAVLGFAFRFVAGWAIVIVLISWFPVLDRWAVDHTVASLVGAARLFRVACSTAGTSIQLAGTALQIVPDCTPLMPFAALAIALFAFPASWRWRLLGLAGGAAALWVYNLLRIFALASVLHFRPDWFEFIHVYLWQTMTLLVVFVMFVGWLRLQSGAPVAARATAPAPPSA